MILAFRTDKPEAELYLYDDGSEVAKHTWHADRQLSDTMLIEIEKILTTNGSQLENLTGIIAYKGPGSFTGLRIGLSVANALAYSLQIPVVAAGGDNWRETGQDKIKAGVDEKVVLPEYDRPANITKPKK